MQLTYSSELMKNYLHAEIISPQDKFDALQTHDGHSLLFGIGTDGVFNLVKETSGATAAGWSLIDLSSAQIGRDFSGQPDAKCRTFEAGQSVVDGSLGLAMVVTASAGDRLYLCLGNSNTDTSWAAAPVWTARVYDNPNVAMPKLAIVGVFFCEVSGGQQYIIVDILRDPASPTHDISRYYIDPAATDGYYWHRHDLPIDIEADNYSSCIGRAPKGLIDGLYTAGRAGSSGQLVFCPLFNVFGGGPPTPVRLNLPDGAVPSAIASTRNPDLSSDLFVASGSSLYYFASTNQKDSAQGVPLFQTALFQGVSRLFAFRTATDVYVWALNQANQVFYSTCPLAQVATPAAWSYPLPIVTGVDLISPYVNCVNDGNSFFAVGGDELYRMTRSPATGLWATQSIALPAPSPSTPAQSFSSYTTRVQLADDNKQPSANTTLLLSASTRGGFYVNNLYYILDTAPIPVATDPMGSITIIESIDSLHGTRLTLSEAGGVAVQINPMDTPMNKVAQLNSTSNLQGAVITNGKDGTTRPLVAPGASTGDLQTVATACQNLSQVYHTVSTPATSRTFSLAAYAVPQGLASFPDAISVDLGDLFSWLESGVESIIHIVEDAVTGAWNFVAKIAGQIYRAVLDCAETVIGALMPIWTISNVPVTVMSLTAPRAFLPPMASIISGEAPMNLMPFSLHTLEKVAFSERNP